MKRFTIEDASSPLDAVARFHRHDDHSVYSAGGTTMTDLLKLNVKHPERVINLLPWRDSARAITSDDRGITIGALATMAEVLASPIVTKRFAVVADAIRLAASAQIRNAATIGGNLLQRTRCAYFRDTHAACNKRTPGSGCSALKGDSRGLAVLGASHHCIANYPGDLAIALVALDAQVTLMDTGGEERVLALEDLHRMPGDEPHIETNLRPGELITSVTIPTQTWQSSLYLKIRDRASYAFALTSAAVAVNIEQSNVRDVRIALGGLATKPWRCREAERFLIGKPVTIETAAHAATLCLTGAQVDDYRRFKVELGKRTVVRALLDVAEVQHSSSDLDDNSVGEINGERHD